MSIILIGTDNRCLCDCATKCVLGRGGSAPKCTKEELQNEGFKVVEIKDQKSVSIVHNAIYNNLKLKIRKGWSWIR